MCQVKDQKNKREQAIRDAKSSLILDAARKVFAQKGFYETRLEDIANEAGFSKASLYNYFQDKEEIFFSIAVRESNLLIDAIQSACTNEKSLVNKLRSILLTIFRLFGQHFELMLSQSDLKSPVAFRDEMCKHKDLFEQMQQSFTLLLNVLKDCFEAAKQSGEIKTGIDSMKLAYFMGSLIRGSMIRWRSSGEMGNIEETVQELLDFTFNGVVFIKAKETAGR
jgi:AcrR family transcriptional regulator